MMRWRRSCCWVTVACPNPRSRVCKSTLLYQLEGEISRICDLRRIDLSDASGVRRRVLSQWMGIHHAKDARLASGWYAIEQE